MKIISWNCQQGFINKDKYKRLIELAPDIAIIPECQNTDQFMRELNIYDGIWCGKNENKGLGIISLSDKYKLSIIKEFPSFEWIVPIKVTGEEDFTLIAVWPIRQEGISYGKYVLTALSEYGELLRNQHVIIMGDFNIDQKLKASYRGIKGMGEINEFLGMFGIRSCYHHFTNESFGEEATPTYYHHRKKDQPFHIDYCFVSQSILDKNTRFCIKDNDVWQGLSDHLPLILEMN
ncbi:endonuclease/exonuclease/phosphatase family protein [Bacillus suaedaesalsae]|uniref:Endonuclease/exonuclease/phosphatase family protein n=1 Tax=Bacillus suaedaesalsae TaxID=2810349 RepID=A0ABS2DHG5_9BACI|nr:endonuclease/exonuclease/phosphatase family protein [Bacillus suaedaesalsae]MBM6617879.1 endonuclease/exonuclease/phosphatase family protein [Bacillus suaedaesalsae]